jgi:hypothetical protein
VVWNDGNGGATGGGVSGYFVVSDYQTQNDINPVTDNKTGFLNPGYSAAAGWDACSGIGSPIGTKLLQSM